MSEEYSRHFLNGEPIVLPRLRTRDLNIDQFPIVEDFRIQLRVCGGGMGWHLDFLSRELGYLAGFPWWDHVDLDLQRFSLEDIFLGTRADPYSEQDQSWQIVIFEADGFVHVLENQGSESDDPSGETFPTWFRVPRQQYVDEWTKAIDRFNPVSRES